MSINRRDFLTKSLQAGALLVAAPSIAAPFRALSPAFGTAPEKTPRPIVLLRTAGDESFIDAAKASLQRTGRSPHAELALTDWLAFDASALRRELGSHRGARIAGVMDNGTGTLLEEAIRDFGGAVVCRGLHSGDVTQRGFSRHQFTSVPESEGIGAAFASAMKADGQSFVVQEIALHEPRHSAGSQRASLNRGPWPSLLGASLAQLAAGVWKPGPFAAEIRTGSGTDFTSRRSFVSIVADI